MPQALDDITRRIAQKEIEREAIKREGDEERVKAIEKEIAEMRDEEKKLHREVESRARPHCTHPAG